MIPLIPNYEEEVLFVSNNSKIHKIALAITKLEYITRLIIATVILTKAEKIVKKKNNFAVAKQIAAILVFVPAVANTSMISAPNSFSNYLNTGRRAVSKRSFIKDLLSFSSLLNWASCLTSVYKVCGFLTSPSIRCSEKS